MSDPTAPLRRRRPASAIVALAVLLCAAPTAARAQIAIVVNPANTLEELSLDKLRRLFLGQAKTFPTGAHARLGLHVPSAGAFDRSALGLTPQIVRSRWMAMVFRGEVTAVPTELATADDVKQFVHTHPDAIAFLPLGEVDGTVKAVAIEGKRPSETGYAIR